jgi:DNA-directed RNA polymerase specialized sigma24 family protein
MGDLTQEQFDSLLGWLDADRNAAALKYAKIQLRIIRIFACRGCCEAETLADDTFDRVASKIEWLIVNYVGDPTLYFYGVAQNVYREYLRRKPPADLPEQVVDSPNPEEDERVYECLTSCMGQLPSENTNLVLSYYEGEKQTKITNRKRLAEELGITLDALRIRVHRIRRELRKCVFKCLDRFRNTETISGQMHTG